MQRNGSEHWKVLPVKRVVDSQVQSEKLVSDRRDRIVRAAITVFHERGFHVATTADIAKEAGLTQSNIYNYVKSKQDVLFLVCEHLVGMYDSVLNKVVAEESDPYLRIVEAIRSTAGVMNQHRDELQLLYNETHALDKRDRMHILASVSRFIGRFQKLLDDYVVAGGRIDFDRRLAANFLSFVPAMSALRSWDLAFNCDADVEEGVLRFCLNGLGMALPHERQDNANAEPAVSSRNGAEAAA